MPTENILKNNPNEPRPVSEKNDLRISRRTYKTKKSKNGEDSFEKRTGSSPKLESGSWYGEGSLLKDNVCLQSDELIESKHPAESAAESIENWVDERCSTSCSDTNAVDKFNEMVEFQVCWITLDISSYLKS